MNFSGSESSGEVLVALTLSVFSTRNNTVMISLNGMTATGHKNYLKSSHPLVHINVHLRIDFIYRNALLILYFAVVECI